ncbi:MAG: class I SAM-dependent methyltransferase [Thiomargarita sp.]|nr:class I SAM-dependent methyltransferase [Thiomargarita sp.]
MQDTKELLAEHHNNGEDFIRLMRETADNRFNDAFWITWEQWITPILGDSPKIADFGSGPGILLDLLDKHYPQAELTGVEYATYMLDTLDQKHYQIIEHDLHLPNLSILNNSLDVVTTIFCLHELTQPITLLRSVYRCLKPGGRCFIIDWVRNPLSRYIAEEVRDKDVFEPELKQDVLNNVFNHFIEHNRYTREDVTWLLEKLGFKILEDIPLKEGKFGQWIVEK